MKTMHTSVLNIERLKAAARSPLHLGGLTNTGTMRHVNAERKKGPDGPDRHLKPNRTTKRYMPRVWWSGIHHSPRKSIPHARQISAKNTSKHISPNRPHYGLGDLSLAKHRKKRRRRHSKSNCKFL